MLILRVQQTHPLVISLVFTPPFRDSVPLDLELSYFIRMLGRNDDGILPFWARYSDEGAGTYL